MHWENADWVYESKSAQKKMFNFYKHTLQCFGGTKFILIDKDEKKPYCGDPTIDYKIYENLEEALLDTRSKFELVFLENISAIPEGVNYTSLKDFVHPTGDTLYVVGSNYNQLDLQLLKNKGFLGKNHVININIPGIALWSHVALGIALYDRISKEK